MNILKLIVTALILLAFCLPVSLAGEKEKPPTGETEKAEKEKEKKEKKKEKVHIMGMRCAECGRRIWPRLLGPAAEKSGPGSKGGGNIRGGTAFELPRELPNGAVPKFHGAREVFSVEYSGGTELKAYLCSDAEKLMPDFETFAEKMEKISEEDSKKLAAHEAVLEESDKAPAIYFVLQESVVSFRFKPGTAKAAMLSIGEAFLRTEEERRAKIFAAPGPTMAAARKAVSEYDFAALRIAFLDEVSPAAKDHLKRLPAEFRDMRNRTGCCTACSPTPTRYDSDINAALESETDDKAVMAIKAVDGKPHPKSFFTNIPWIAALCGRHTHTGAQIKAPTCIPSCCPRPRERRSYIRAEIMGFRCYMLKRDGRWFIDLDANLSADAEIPPEPEEKKLTETGRRCVECGRQFIRHLVSSAAVNDSKKSGPGSKGGGNIKGGTAFELPRELPSGAVAKFHGAREVVYVEYSGGTELKAHLYTDAEKLASDFETFAEKVEKISVNDSKILAAHGAVLEKSDKAPAVYFVFQESVVSFRFKHGTARASMLSIGEAFLRAEEERRAEIFATPRSTMEAARKAVSEYDLAALRIAFLDEVSPAAKDHLERLRAEFRNMRNRTGYSPTRYDSDIDAALESETDDEAVMAIKSVDGKPHPHSFFTNIPWVRALCGRRVYTGTEIMGFRCYMVKRRGRWFVELDANLSTEAEILLESEEKKLTETEMRIVKVLRIIYESQAAFYADDFDGDGRRDYARNLGELLESLGEKGKGIKTLLDENAAYELSISAKDGEPHWYATAEPRRMTVRIGDRPVVHSGSANLRFFYIDETGVVRVERGKPANSKSEEYEE